MNRSIGMSAGLIALVALIVRALAPTSPVSQPEETSASATVKPPKPSPRKKAEKADKAEKKEAPAPVAKPEEDYLEGPWLATQHFYGEAAETVAPVDFSAVDQVESCAGEPFCRSGIARYFGILEPADAEKAEFLLATVPDPLHSRLSLFTDSSIQAIQTGANAAGWQFATQWMPWNDKVNPDEKDPKDRRKQREDIRNQERQPGIMVFRRTPNGSGRRDSRVLIVFLAGETPTAGINPAQFQLARAYMDAIHAAAEVRIQGPTFSGSFYSLGKLVERDKGMGVGGCFIARYSCPGFANPIRDKANSSKWNWDRYQPRILDHGACSAFDDFVYDSGTGFGRSYRVRSGTASLESAAQQLPCEVDFRSATANAQDQANYFGKVLRLVGIPFDRAAVLIEDESGFGEGIKGVAKGNSALTVFRFPRDISHLRNAYREAVQSTKSDSAAAPDLDFSLKDQDIGEDSIPTFSSAQTPLAQNGIMNEIASAIRRDHFRIVQVSATNVLDLLFVARLLKRECPDTRLMLGFPDLLFIQAAQTDNLTGTLALSTYPMFAASNPWIGRQYSPSAFSDANSEGVYNATVLLLDGSGALADYHWMALPHAPTWLLTLDRQGFMPVDVFPHSHEEEQNEVWFEQIRGSDSTSLQLPPPGMLWRFISITISIFSLAIAIGIWTLERDDSFHLGAWLTCTRIRSENVWRQFYIFLFLLIPVFMQMVILLPSLQAIEWPHEWLFIVPAVIGCISLLLAATFLLSSGLAKAKDRVLCGSCAVTLFSAMALWGLICFHSSPDEYRSFFFAFRAMELRVGSSASWPILSALCALLVFAFVHLTRLYLVTCQRPMAVTGGITTVLQPRLKEAYGNFNRSLRSAIGPWKSVQWRWFWSCFTLAALICAWGRIDAQLHSIDGTEYNVLSLSLQLLVILSLIVAAWQILHLWHAFQSFLHCLDTLPLASSFGPIDHAANRPIWVRWLNLQSVDVHVRSLAVLHDMTLIRGLLSVPHVGWYRTLLGENLARDSRSVRKEVLRIARDLSSVSSFIAVQLIRIVHDHWGEASISSRVLNAPADSAASTPAVADPQPMSADENERFCALAENFLALHYTSFILYGVRQLQNLILFLSVGFVLLMFSMHSYSFQAPQFIGRLSLALFAALASATWVCLSGMERDPILSRINGTDPHKLNADFYFKLLSYGALPVLGLLAAEFPQIANFLLSTVEPALTALH